MRLLPPWCDGRAEDDYRDRHRRDRPGGARWAWSPPSPSREASTTAEGGSPDGLAGRAGLSHPPWRRVRSRSRWAANSARYHPLGPRPARRLVVLVAAALTALTAPTYAGHRPVGAASSGSQDCHRGEPEPVPEPPPEPAAPPPRPLPEPEPPPPVRSPTARPQARRRGRVEPQDPAPTGRQGGRHHGPTSSACGRRRRRSRQRPCSPGSRPTPRGSPRARSRPRRARAP